MDSYSQVDPFFFGKWDVVLPSFSLDIIGASDSVHSARELDEERVADRLDLSSIVTIQSLSDQSSLLF